MDPTVKLLIAILEEGVRVLRDRDGLPLSEALVSERACNIATALLGSFDIGPRSEGDLEPSMPVRVASGSGR